MSFILDALKKSESERQNRSGAEFSSIPASSPAPARRPWPWLIGALLAINLAVLLGILFRPGTGSPTPAAPVSAAPAPQAAGATNAETVIPAPANPAPTGAAEPATEPPAQAEAATFEERIASARMNQRVAPLQESGELTNVPEQALAGTATALPEQAADPAPAVASTSQLKTIDELRLQGEIALPELRVDMHVYSEEPSRRFVFINMKKYRERSRLDEGPLIREIRPDGLLLEHDGRVFLLPRE